MSRIPSKEKIPRRATSCCRLDDEIVRASLQTAVSIIALSPHFNTFHHAFFIFPTIDEPKIVKKHFPRKRDL
jgi:hypothetical protein